MKVLRGYFMPGFVLNTLDIWDLRVNLSKMDPLWVGLLQISMKTNYPWALREPALDEVEMEEHGAGLACDTDANRRLGIQPADIPWWSPHWYSSNRRCWAGISGLEPRFCPSECCSIPASYQAREGRPISYDCSLNILTAQYLSPPRDWQCPALFLGSTPECNGWQGNHILATDPVSLFFPIIFVPLALMCVFPDHLFDLVAWYHIHSCSSHFS